MLTTQSSEQSLITGASNGDLESFNQLMLKYQDLVYHHASMLVHEPDAADDITQESFIKAFQSIRSFRGGSFRAWLLKITTNTAHDRWRRFGRHPTIPLVPEDKDGSEIESPTWLADQNASVEEAVQRRQVSYRLHQLLNELPTSYRNVITLIDVYELDYTEAAVILQIPLGTVKSRLARARLQLRDKLQGTSSTSLSWAA